MPSRIRHVTALLTPRRESSGATRDRRAFFGGGVLTLLVAALLFAQFDIHDGLSRDEAIYAYGGQQLVDGVPFYVSIFDVKPPLAATIAATGVVGGRAVDLADITGIRLAFFVFACLTVLAVYMLGTWLFDSLLGGLLAAATFVSFEGFAVDALTGPNAKTPGVFFAVLAMALLVRRRYFWGGFAAALAFLVWQPLALYVAVACLAALLTPESERRWRLVGQALGGAAIPVAVTAVYYWLEGALDDLADGVFVYPFTHLDRRGVTLGDRLEKIARVVSDDYPQALFYGGVALLVAAAAFRLLRSRADLVPVLRTDPLLNVVFLSFLLVAAVSLTDFQGYPDLYPLLPYAAIGVAGGFDLLARRLDGTPLHPATAVVGTAVAVVLVVAAAVGYAGARSGDRLLQQLETAESVERLLPEGEAPYVLGNSTPLVLTDRRAQNRYIYLGAGFDDWVIDHTDGGLAGWQAQIAREDPAMILLTGGWKTETADVMRRWLEATYPGVRRNGLRVFLRPDVYEQAEERGLVRRRD